MLPKASSSGSMDHVQLGETQRRGQGLSSESLRDGFVLFYSQEVKALA